MRPCAAARAGGWPKIPEDASGSFKVPVQFACRALDHLRNEMIKSPQVDAKLTLLFLVAVVWRWVEEGFLFSSHRPACLWG